MSSSSGAAAHSEKGGATAAVDAEGAASKADGAGIGIVTGLNGRCGSSVSGGGEGEGRADGYRGTP